MSTKEWSEQDIAALFELPFFDLIYQAHTVHRNNFDLRDIDYCTLSSIKTGACPEDCSYCSQSGRYNTGLKKERLIDVEAVIEQAKEAKANGSKRFCMGAAWRNPPKKDFPKVLEMVKAVKAMGLETCVTLGMLDSEQAQGLKEAGLDYYNHNLDTSPEFYGTVITTRTYDDRLETLQNVMDADINVCCGGIMGMGETRNDRVRFLLALSKLEKAPQSIPINKLIPMKGTPLAEAKAIDDFEFIRTIAVARIVFPSSRVRLSAGRENMPKTTQAWCFMAGANSIWLGDKLLTANNSNWEKDIELMKELNFYLPETQAAEACVD